jgi:protein-arginine kinase activator protein McsA
MAVRYGCPIYTFDFIMDTAGVTLDETEEQSEPSEGAGAKTKTTKTKSISLEEMGIPSLEKLLEEALQKEDYEKAAQIRDILHSKKGNDS